MVAVTAWDITLFVPGEQQNDYISARDMMCVGGAALWPHIRKCALRDKLTLIKMMLLKFPHTPALFPSPTPVIYAAAIKQQIHWR